MSANAGTIDGGGIVNSSGTHPKGLYVLFATEMWERFSFYSMLALFTLYLRDSTQGFGWTAAEATALYANYLAFVYASPLIDRDRLFLRTEKTLYCFQGRSAPGAQ